MVVASVIPMVPAAMVPVMKPSATISISTISPSKSVLPTKATVHGLGLPYLHAHLLERQLCQLCLLPNFRQHIQDALSRRRATSKPLRLPAGDGPTSLDVHQAPLALDPLSVRLLVRLLHVVCRLELDKSVPFALPRYTIMHHPNALNGPKRLKLSLQLALRHILRQTPHEQRTQRVSLNIRINVWIPQLQSFLVRLCIQPLLLLQCQNHPLEFGRSINPHLIRHLFVQKQPLWLLRQLRRQHISTGLTSLQRSPAPYMANFAALLLHVRQNLPIVGQGRRKLSFVHGRQRRGCRTHLLPSDVDGLYIRIPEIRRQPVHQLALVADHTQPSLLQLCLELGHLFPFQAIHNPIQVLHMLFILHLRLLFHLFIQRWQRWRSRLDIPRLDTPRVSHTMPITATIKVLHVPCQPRIRQFWLALPRQLHQRRGSRRLEQPQNMGRHTRMMKADSNRPRLPLGLLQPHLPGSLLPVIA